MFVTIATLRENACPSITGGKTLIAMALESWIMPLAKRQHPAIRRGARFAVRDTACCFANLTWRRRDGRHSVGLTFTFAALRPWNKSSFYRAILISNSVCSSVCLSVRDVPVLDENGLTYCHSFFTICSPIILVLSASNIFTKFWRGHPLRGQQIHWYWYSNSVRPSVHLFVCPYKNFAIFYQ